MFPTMFSQIKVPFLKQANLYKKYFGFEKNKEELDAQCSKKVRKKDCNDLLINIPESKLKSDDHNDHNNPYTDRFEKGETVHTKQNLKEQFLKFVRPKEKEKKDIFDTCTKDAPCNLECLYGRKITEEKENPEEAMVKGFVYTKGGAVYETIAYRLPDDSGWEKDRHKPKKETPYFQIKKKKNKKPEIMEFTGPVKIIIMDSDGFFTSYGAKRFHAALIQLGYILIGCTIMCIFFYALKFNHHYSTNAHIFCCLLAFQYCLPAAQLCNNRLSVSGYMLSTKHQFRDTLIIKTFAILNIFVGVGILHSWRLYIYHGDIFNSHSIPGYKACASAVAEYILRYMSTIIIGFDRGHIIDCYLHILSIMSAFHSLQCFYYALTLKYDLMHYYKYKHWYLWVFSFAVFFAFVAVIRPALDCLFHLWLHLRTFARRVFKFLRPRTPCTPRDVKSGAQRKAYPYGL